MCQGILTDMAATTSYGRARGDFERACRSAFKLLEKAGGRQAVEALAVVEAAGDRVRAALVHEMRSAGYSWADVGDVLGVSRQSAWERYGSEE